MATGVSRTSITPCHRQTSVADEFLVGVCFQGQTGSGRRAVRATLLTLMYGPAVRCKKISESWR
jgi:hypothetical protein